MIIFGTRARTVTSREGTFFCPSCRAERPFRLQEVKRYFTLYFVPVFPVSTLGSFVVCETCAGEFRPEVLSLDLRAMAASGEGRLQDAARAVLIGVAHAGGDALARIDELATTFQQTFGVELDRDALRGDLVPAKASSFPAKYCVGELAGRLDDEGRERVLSAGVRAAHARTPPEVAFLTEAGKLLGMTDAHVRGLLA